MHRSYNKPIPVEKVVASGFRDSCGLYVRATESELQQTRQWMETMGIGHLDGRIFTKISSGEQRLALLARAFVKNPQLLILDEPFHGLDEANIQRVNSIICRYTEQRPDCALIMVSHYMDELPQCISNVYDLSRREILKNS
jgi:molybdate transport system ATP-binding protein